MRKEYQDERNVEGFGARGCEDSGRAKTRSELQRGEGLTRTEGKSFCTWKGIFQIMERGLCNFEIGNQETGEQLWRNGLDLDSGKKGKAGGREYGM
ncbi:unnamed protein product [Calypogeia fissa]